MVSLLALADGHRALEVGLVGCEGMLGVPLTLGVRESPVRALVQGSGTALRMKSAPFLNELRHNLPLQRAVSRYTYDLMVQVTQTAACNRFHQVEARLARWLLMTRDRMRSNEFRLTQDMLGNMLGVLRVAVTKAAGTLQRRKLIRYTRGAIRILDSKALEAIACRCYQIVKDKDCPTLQLALGLARSARRREEIRGLSGERVRTCARAAARPPPGTRRSALASAIPISLKCLTAVSKLHEG